MLHLIPSALPLPCESIRAFCEKHHITRLWLFGSVLGDDFRPDSDVDVLVEFDPAHVPGWKIVAMQAELSAIIGREVQFSMPGALNRHSRSRIMANARMIYRSKPRR